MIDSSWKKIDEPAFRWIHFIYFPEKTKAKTQAEIKKLMAENLLALKWHLREDSHYNEYLFREKRSRYYHCLNWYGKKYIGENFSPKDVALNLGFLFDSEKAVKEIQANRIIQKGKVLLRKKANSIFIGKFQDKSISLADVNLVFNKSEYRALLTSKPFVIQQYLDLAKELLAAKEAYQLSLKEFQLIGKEKQVEWIDEAFVARSYLAVKYHYSMKGVYPTKKFRVQLTPAELYAYFGSHKHLYQKVIAFDYRFTVITGEKKADKFLHEYKNRQNNKQNFFLLAKKYAASPFFISTARYKKLSVAQMKSEQTALSLKKKIQSFALDMASKAVLSPKKFPVTKKQFAIIQVRNIEYQNNHLQLQDVITAVHQDMERDLFQEQFKIDLKDTM
ncbi:MAG: hypothetical protein D6767_07195, partial [Candidatus Hydrogenedentota bacterium]